MACDIVSKVVITHVETYGFQYYSWYMRLCFVALLVCNLPYTWSLIIDTFPGIKTWSSERSENSITSAPKFWAEKKWHDSILCCGGGRKKGAASTANAKLTSQSDTYQGLNSSELPRSEKDDASIVGRMVGGELADPIDVEKSAGRPQAPCQKCGHNNV